MTHTMTHTSFLILATHPDDEVRRAEFEQALQELSTPGDILTLPITRRLSVGYLRAISASLREQNARGGFDTIATHSLVGDDHFHPQHIMTAMAALLFSLRHKLNLVVYDPFPDETAAQTVSRFWRMTEGRGPARIAKATARSLLWILHIVIFRQRLSPMKVNDLSVLNRLQHIYKSQNLGYQSFTQNLWHYRALRPLHG